MPLLAEPNTLWPAWLISTVRTVRGGLAWFAEHSLAGLPLDWIVRFVLMGGAYLVLRRWLSRRSAAAGVVAVLLAKELLDIVAHLDLLSPRAPDLGDVADVLSGLAGVAVGIVIDRRLRK